MNYRAAKMFEEAEAKLAARCLVEALALFHAAECAGAEPDRCAAGRWSAHMLGGEFESAWRESDAIRRRGAPDPHRFWHGEPLAGQRVIVRCLHGLGDAIQFLRYLPRLRGMAESIVLEVPPRLVNLARSIEGADEVITWGDQAPRVPTEWTVQIEVMELPYIFRTQPHHLPICQRYLRLPPPAPHNGANLRVGIVGKAGAWNSARSVPWGCVEAILSVSGCEFWDLHGEESFQRNGRETTGTALHKDSECRETIEGLATRIAALDLVITVDTLAAHLAGALGVPAWVMLQFAADWRWLHDREDSSWYPSLRLFHQTAPGDWESVQRAVIEALQQRVAATRQERQAA